MFIFFLFLYMQIYIKFSANWIYLVDSFNGTKQPVFDEKSKMYIWILFWSRALYF